MKKLKKLAAILLTVFVLFGVLMSTAFAADVTQDGLQVSLVTDKEAYKSGEQITATLTVKNTNDFAVKNVTLENLIPDGYVLADGSQATKSLESLEPGETAELAVTFIANGETPTEPTEPTDPTNPTDPTDPTEPTEPTDPTDADEPIDPGFTDNGLWKVIFPIMGVTGFVAIIIALAHFKKFLALILAAIIGGSVITGGIIKASAEDSDIRNISIETIVDVAGEPKKINGNVSYSYVEPEKEEVEIYNRPISDENIKFLDNGRAYISDEILLTAKDGVTKSEIEKLVKEYNGKIVGYISLTNDYQIQFKNVGSFEELEKISNEILENALIDTSIVNYVDKIDADFYPSDPYDGDDWNTLFPGGKNWALEAVDAPGAWDYRGKLSTIRLGIIDTMFDTNHEDLKRKFVPGGVWNNPTNVRELYNGDRENDLYHHGTHVAGIASAEFNNGKGVSGTAPNTELYGYALCNKETGEYEYDNFIKYEGIMDFKVALGQLLAKGVKVINISIGFDEYCIKASQDDQSIISVLNTGSKIFSDYLGKWLNAGYDFVICQSAGNNNRDKSFTALAKYDSYFANIEEKRIKDRIIVVGAVDPKLSITDFSNVGNRVDVMAPGEKVFSCLPSDNYNYLMGTSMATPIVSGIASMVWGANKTLKGDEVKWIIKSTASGKVKDTDVKMVNAKKAVKASLKTIESAPIYKPYECGVINGIVSEPNGERISEAIVSIYDGEKLVFCEKTDILGEFSAILPEGNYWVKVSHPDFVELKNVPLEIKAGESIHTGYKLMAKFAGGNGTEENPYQISTPQQLNNVRYNLDAHFIQTNDIDMSSWGNWEPIGEVLSFYPSDDCPLKSHPFTGTYDGQSFAIKNLTITGNDDELPLHDCYGLFAGAMNATIKNVNLQNLNIDIDKSNVDYNKIPAEYRECITFVGGILGTEDVNYEDAYKPNIITNCTVSGNISVSNFLTGYVGGIAGADSPEKCKNFANISVKTDRTEKFGDGGTCCWVGGIVGRHIYVSLDMPLSYCSNYGNVHVESNDLVFAGGISGEPAIISDCVNYGDIYGKSNNLHYQYDGESSMGSCSVGGICGASCATVEKSVNYGKVSAVLNGEKEGNSKLPIYAGGIVGTCEYDVGGRMNSCYNISDSVDSIRITNQGKTEFKNAGRIGGFAVEYTNCYSLKDTLVNKKSVTCAEHSHALEDFTEDWWDITSCYAHGADLTREDFLKEETYIGFDFENTWKIDPKVGGAVLR